MKHYLLVCLLALGCKANVMESNTPATPPEAKPAVAAEAQPTLGQCATSAGHYVWNKAKGAYDYVTSEEAQVTYYDTWEKVKAASKNAYDGAVKTYNEYQEESNKEETSEAP